MFKPLLKATSKVIKKVDKTSELIAALEELASKDVLVGITQEKNSRKDGQIGNADLGYIMAHGARTGKAAKKMEPSLKAGVPYTKATEAYIHEKGDPLHGIPPRPFLEPAIKANIARIRALQKKAIEAALRGDKAEVDAVLTDLGLLGRRVVYKWFTDPRNNWAPNAPSTIAAKSKPGKISDRPLIDTGALRRSITFVIRKR